MKCSRCQHNNEAGSRFCEEWAAPQARACVRCGRLLSATAKFCPECAQPSAPTPIPHDWPDLVIGLCAGGVSSARVLSSCATGTLQAPGKDLLYFGYVTLATLGYGDVVPVSDGARSQAVLESLCGTIYMAILVARLIGLHLTHTGSQG
jgi:Ion channel/Double zinc ribbon